MQSAYLVGVSHPSSIPASPQLIDQSKVAISSHVISSSCQQLDSRGPSRTLARSISRHSSVLCDASKRAAFLSSSLATWCDFLQAVRSVADNTATVLRGIQVYTCTYMYIHVWMFPGLAKQCAPNRYMYM